ncbi:MAG: diguanylate cyclase, partial [Actinomycetota bacterium]
MRTELGSKTVARLAAYLLVASGVLSAAVLPLPQLPGINRGAVLVVAALAVCIGGLTYLLPWQLWPKKATLVLLPVAFVLIGLGNYFGSARSYSYSVYFVVAFVWLGISHPRWTSLWFAPLAVIAYITPIVLQGEYATADASAASTAIPVCVLVAEVLAYVVAGEQRSRKVAHALQRAASNLGQHLQEAEVTQSLVDESRLALHAESAMLFIIDPQTMTVTHMAGSGLPEIVQSNLHRSIGNPTPDVPEELFGGKPLVVEDAASSTRPGDRDMFKRFGVKSYLAFPVRWRGQLVGILSAWETTRHRRYGSDDISLAEGLAGQASAAIANARLYEQTLAASRSDALTGLGNRRAFRERLESEVERARRYGRDLSLLVLDADRFKSINDTFGHQAGDRTLIRMGELLQRNRRMEDGAFRIGGDEFALVLPETGMQGATVLAERLRRRIEHAVVGGERDVPLTVSIGAATFGEHGISADELFERADAALYEVKATGGNAIALPATGDATNSRLGVDIDALIEGGHLRAFYQPIFDLRTGTVMAFEAFCRIDPAVGHTPTTTLFRAAAASGRVAEFDALCRSIALSSSGEISPDVLLFMNVSPAAMEADDFDVNQIVHAVTAAGLSAERVVIEITEHDRTPRSTRLVRSLKACQQAGLMLALDDFGAGGSDLDLLAGTRFDFVKVDMSFI